MGTWHELCGLWLLVICAIFVTELFFRTEHKGRGKSTAQIYESDWRFFVYAICSRKTLWGYVYGRLKTEKFDVI